MSGEPLCKASEQNKLVWKEPDLAGWSVQHLCGQHHREAVAALARSQMLQRTFLTSLARHQRAQVQELHVKRGYGPDSPASF